MMFLKGSFYFPSRSNMSGGWLGYFCWMVWKPCGERLLDNFGPAFILQNVTQF